MASSDGFVPNDNDFVCSLRASNGDYSKINDWRAAIACDLTVSSTKVFTVSDRGNYDPSVDDGKSVTFTGGGTGTLKHISTFNKALIVNCSGTINTGTVTINGSGHTFTISDTGQQVGNVVLSCYNDWADGFDESYIDIKNFVTDNNHRVVIWTDPNESGTQGPNRHNGTAESGFYIKNSGNNYTFVFRVSNVVVEGIEIQQPSKPAYAVLYNTSDSLNNTFRCLIIHNVGGIINRGAGSTVENCIFYDFGSSGFSVVRFGKVRNCTIYAAAGVGSYSGQIIVRDAECYNVLAYNEDSGTGYNDFYGNCTGDYNISSDNSAPGAHSQHNKTLDDIKFVSTTPGSEDLHIQADSCARDAGTDLSSYFTDDIDGDTRSGAWDIGADEYISEGGVMTQSETFSVGDSMNLQLVSIRTFTDLSTIIDAIVPMHQTSLLESVNMFDTRSLSTVSVQTEYLSLFDQLTIIIAVERIFDELFQIIDELPLTREKELIFHETIEFVDTLSYVILVTREISETVLLQDILQSVRKPPQVQTLVENIEIEDVLFKQFEKIFDELAQFIQYPTLAEYEYFIGEEFELMDTLSGEIVLLMLLKEMLQMSSILSYEKFGIKIETFSETLTLIDVFSTITIRQAILLDVIQAEDVVNKIRTLVIQKLESLQMLDTLNTAKWMIVILADLMTTEDRLSFVMQYVLTQTETLTLEDILTLFGAQIVSLYESINMEDYLSYVISQILAVKETLEMIDRLQSISWIIIYCVEITNIEDTLSKTVQAIVTTIELFSIEDILNLSEQYLRELSESIVIADTLSILARNLIYLSELLDVTDSFVTTGILHQTLLEIIFSEDILNTQSAILLTFVNVMSLSDIVSLNVITLVDECILLDDVLIKVLYVYLEFQLTEIVSVEDLFLVLLSYNMLEMLNVSDYTVFVAQYMKRLLEEAIVSDILNLLTRGLIVLYETLDISDVFTVTGEWYRICIEMFTITDNIIIHFSTYRTELMLVEDTREYIFSLKLRLFEILPIMDAYSVIMQMTLIEESSAEDLILSIMTITIIFDELINSSDLMTVTEYYQLIEYMLFKDVYSRQMEIYRICNELLKLSVGLFFRIPGVRILKETITLADKYSTVVKIIRLLTENVETLDVLFVRMSIVISREELIQFSDKWFSVQITVQYMTEIISLSDTLTFVKRIPFVSIFMESIIITDRMRYNALTIIWESTALVDIFSLYRHQLMIEIIRAFDMELMLFEHITVEPVALFDGIVKIFEVKLLEITKTSDTIIGYGQIIMLQELTTVKESYGVIFQAISVEPLIIEDVVIKLIQLFAHETFQIIVNMFQNIMFIAAESMLLEEISLYYFQFMMIEIITIEDTISTIGLYLKYPTEVFVIADTLEFVVPLAYTCELIISTIGSVTLDTTAVGSITISITPISDILLIIDGVGTVQKTVSKIGEILIEWL